MQVAGNMSIPQSVASKLVKSKNKDVIKELAANPSIPGNSLNELVEMSLKKMKSGKSDWIDRDLELGLASNPNSPATYLTALLKHSDSWVVATVAGNPNLPPDKLAKLAKSDHDNIRKGVASNPSAPWVLLQSLLKDEDCKWQLAQNPAMRGDDLAELALQKTAGPNLLADIAMNPSLSSDQIEKLAKHKDVWVRLGIARNPNTPQEIRKGILEGFLKLKSEENEGDIYLIRCELTPPEMIDEVLERYLPLKSTNREDRLSYIARNPNTRPETLAKLAGDRFTEVRIAVAKNPNTPVETLRQLSQ
jgi:pentose-5-phosphate-3-epimerase